MPKKILGKHIPLKKNAPKRPIFFYILIRSWNSYEYFDKCIDSVLFQDYKHYKILFVDDCSDYTLNQKKYIINKVKGHIVVFNKIRKYSVRNAYELIHKYAKNNSGVVVNLDGDDYFSNDKVLSYLAKVYQIFGIDFTYGECLIKKSDSLSNFSLGKNKIYTNVDYPEQIKEAKTFRHFPFLPLHPRTWKVGVFKRLALKNFLIETKWLRYCEDMVIFFPLLENSQLKYKVLKKPLYVYNAGHQFNSVKKWTLDLISEELYIRKNKDKNFHLTNNPKIVFLTYNSLLSLPLVSHLLYLFQLMLLKRNYSNFIFMSRKHHILKQRILAMLAQKKDVIIKTNTITFGHQLHPFDRRLYLDLKVLPKNLKNTTEAYDLMWTLCFCYDVSPMTKEILSKIGIQYLEKVFTS